LYEKIVSFGLQGSVVSTSEEALAALRTAKTAGDPFRMALITHQALALDAGKLGQTVKKDPDLRDTVLVMLTPAGQRGDAMRIADVGFAAYLSGPLRLDEFREAIERVWAAHTRGEKIGLVTRHTVAEGREVRRALPQTPEEYIHAKVLVAEDNPVNQEVAIEILKTLGCEADIAGNGEEAVAMYDAGNYDVIFMDCQMPKMDGYAATRKIRRREDEHEHVPIIAMTAHALKGDREKCLDAGMDDYIAKPVNPETVMDAILRWFHREPQTAEELAGAGAEPAEPAAKPPADAEVAAAAVMQSRGAPPPAVPEEQEVPVLNTAQALEVTGGNASILKRVTKVFLGNIPGEVDQLKQAIEAGQREEARRLAHSIKGASASLGGSRTQRVAFQIEQAAQIPDLDQAKALFPAFRTEFDRLIEALSAIDWDQVADGYKAASEAVK
jgi:CheY-like chemotaxis protein